MKQFTPMTSILAEGTADDAQISFFNVTKEEAARAATRMVVTGRRDYFIREGRYAKLTVGGRLTMSDTDLEQRSNLGVVRCARGDVLIAGLGLGMILVPILANPAVTSVTVLEKSAGVIALMADKLKALPGGEKLTVIHADVFTWVLPKNTMWDTIYFDIWPDITTSNLPEMERLHRKFARRKKKDGWMESWQRPHLKQLQRGGR